MAVLVYLRSTDDPPGGLVPSVFPTDAGFFPVLLEHGPQLIQRLFRHLTLGQKPNCIMSLEPMSFR